MAWKVSGDPQAPQDAIAWFRARVPLTKDQWLELEERARRRAFTVAGVAQLDVVADVWQAMDQAIDQGLPFKDFKAAVRDKLERAWGGTVGNPGYRIETIFRVQVQEAYNAGRWRQMTEPAVLRARPFWLYDAVLDRRTTAICRERDGKIYRADDPWWQTNYPPLHFRCRSGVRTLSAAEAEEFGGESRSKPRAEPHPGFGLAPNRGEWQPAPGRWAAPLQAEYNRKARRAVVESEGEIPQINLHWEDYGREIGDDAIARIWQIGRRLAPIPDGIGVPVVFLRPRIVVERFRRTGFYLVTGDKAQILISVSRPREWIGQPFAFGTMSMVSATGRDAVRAFGLTYAHERWHHRYWQASDAFRTRVGDEYDQALGRVKFVSVQAQQSPPDWFAETVLAFRLQPKALKAFDRAGYNAVRKLLRELDAE